MLSPSLSEALGRGALVLTSTPRAARALHRAWAEERRAAGERSWRAPRIEDWRCWVDGLARRASFERQILTPLQELHLWGTVQREEARQVVAPGRLAELACTAYGLLSAYDAHASRRASWAAAHEDAERFLGWADGFDALCRAADAVPRCGLEQELAERAGESSVEAEEILLVGFERLTPAQETLLAALPCRIAHAQPGEAAANRRLVEAANEGEELRACAEWVRATLEGSRPEVRVGVLVPDLRRLKPELDRVLRRTLQPEAPRAAAGGQAPLYEFSLGVPLAEVPLVDSALLLLRWAARNALPAAEASSLLVGGFAAAGMEEALALALADAELRRRGLLTQDVALGALLGHAERASEQSRGLLPAAFTARMRALLARLTREGAGRKPRPAWASLAGELLQLAGWPGFRELASAAYQARQRWECLLEEVAAVSAVAGPVSFRGFVRELGEAARAALFAAESEDAPVQVLGIDEAAGLHFDAVWAMGLCEGAWPAGGRAHPLLAPGLQRDAGMPHTDPEAELRLARAQLDRVLRSAPEVVLSHARQGEGGIESRPAPLVLALRLRAEPANAPAPVTVKQTRREAVAAHGPRWPEGRSPGGSEVLKRQAACGFQSFAARRLGAVPLDEAAWGLDAGERGALLHRALERLWATEPTPGRLHSRADLRAARADGSLRDLVREAVARAFASTEREARGDPWLTEYLRLEGRRVAARLLAWLAVEAEREPFAVAELEKKVEARVGPLTLRLRMDRLDHLDALDSGGSLLMDYKTADRVSVRQWEGDRMEEPQLPIYAEFAGLERVDQVAFAQIRPGKTKLHVLKDASSFREAWRASLLRLAEEFAEGLAAVDPRDGAATCRMCGLHGVCRIAAVEESDE